MQPWQDPSLLLKGQRFPLDAKLTELFEAAMRTSARVTPALLDELQALHTKALDEAMSGWKAKGQEPPYFRDKRAAEERRRQEAEISDHLQDKRVFSPPDRKAAACIRALEKKGIAVPLALRAWIGEVGAVNLAGAHPGLCFWADAKIAVTYADPLMVVPDVIEMKEWGAERQSNSAAEPLDAVLGWDAAAKARLVVDNEQLDYGYSVTLPDAAADAALKGEPHHTTFVDYLRIAFRWGGFPGWERHDNRPERELRLLTEGLLPI